MDVGPGPSSDAQPSSCNQPEDENEPSSSKDNEEIVQLCKKLDVQLGQKVDEAAKAHNFNMMNVKSLLHHLVKNPQVISMVMGIDDPGKLPSVKVTRSKAKSSDAKVNFRPVHVSYRSFLNVDYDDEDDDDEYVPEKDPAHEEEIERESENEADETLIVEETNMGDKTNFDCHASVSAHMDEVTFTNPLDDSFAMDDDGLLSFDQPSANTRSRATLNSIATMDDLDKECRELLDNANDQMMTNVDDVYWNFLQELHTDDFLRDDEDPDDPDFNVMSEVDDIDEADVDDLRQDRATEIPLREVEGLILDLLEEKDIPNLVAPEVIEANCRKRKSHGNDHPDDPSEKKKKIPRVVIPPVVGDTNSCSLLREDQRFYFSLSELHQLSAQLEQHVQLLAQLAISCQFEEEFATERAGFYTMINELDILFFEYGPSSLFNISNMPSAIESCHDVQKMEKMSTWTPERHANPYVLRGGMQLGYLVSYPRPETCVVLMRSKALRYPNLVPEVAMTTERPTLSCFTESENILLALGMMQFGHIPPSAGPFGKYYYITRNFLPTKTPDQLRHHMRTIRMASSKVPLYKIIVQAECGELKLIIPFEQSISLLGSIDSWPEGVAPRWCKWFAKYFRSVDQHRVGSIPPPRPPPPSRRSIQRYCQSERTCNEDIPTTDMDNSDSVVVGVSFEKSVEASSCSYTKKHANFAKVGRTVMDVSNPKRPTRLSSSPKCRNEEVVVREADDAHSPVCSPTCGRESAPRMDHVDSESAMSSCNIRRDSNSPHPVPSPPDSATRLSSDVVDADSLPSTSPIPCSASLSDVEIKSESGISSHKTIAEYGDPTLGYPVCDDSSRETFVVLSAIHHPSKRTPRRVKKASPNTHRIQALCRDNESSIESETIVCASGITVPSRMKRKARTTRVMSKRVISPPGFSRNDSMAVPCTPEPRTPTASEMGSPDTQFQLSGSLSPDFDYSRDVPRTPRDDAEMTRFASPSHVLSASGKTAITGNTDVKRSLFPNKSLQIDEVNDRDDKDVIYFPINDSVTEDEEDNEYSNPQPSDEQFTSEPPSEMKITQSKNLPRRRRRTRIERFRLGEEALKRFRGGEEKMSAIARRIATDVNHRLMLYDELRTQVHSLLAATLEPSQEDWDKLTALLAPNHQEVLCLLSLLVSPTLISAELNSHPLRKAYQDAFDIMLAIEKYMVCTQTRLRPNSKTIFKQIQQICEQMNSNDHDDLYRRLEGLFDGEPALWSHLRKYCLTLSYDEDTPLSQFETIDLRLPLDPCVENASIPDYTTRYECIDDIDLILGRSEKSSVNQRKGSTFYVSDGNLLAYSIKTHQYVGVEAKYVTPGNVKSTEKKEIRVPPKTEWASDEDRVILDCYNEVDGSQEDVASVASKKLKLGVSDVMKRLKFLLSLFKK